MILSRIELNNRDRDFQAIGRDLAVDPYLLKGIVLQYLFRNLILCTYFFYYEYFFISDLKFCLNAIGYAYSNFAPFFYDKTWQEIVDMNIYDLWKLGINDRRQRNVMVDSFKKFKKAMASIT